MPKLRVITAKELIKFFEEQGFVIDRQKGSHIILIRKKENESQRLVIPNHKELDRGTAYSIYKKSKEYLPDLETRKFFYNE